MSEQKKKDPPVELEAFNDLVGIVHRLRAPGGCPWDRKQTPNSLKQYIVEEAYEVLDAIDAESPKELCEELGDLLLQVLLQAEIAGEKGLFTISDVVLGISSKLINRHPHVFGDVKAKDADAVIVNWEKIKQAEKKDRGLFDGLPRQLPALQLAGRMGEKAARVGFDWPNASEVRSKVSEELREADEVIERGQPSEIRHEIGDLLFSVAQWARHLGEQPEELLRQTCDRFATRFTKMEQSARISGKKLQDLDMQILEELWQRAKNQ